MAESTLSITYADLREEIAFFLGYGRSSANWSTDKTSTINSVLKSGVRQFYYPPKLPSDATAHMWNFLHPRSTLTLGSTTGTMSGTATTTLTATTGVFEARMANPLSDFPTTVTFTASGTSYTVSSVTSTTAVVLTATASAEASDDTFTISSQRDYTLPDDFGGMEGRFAYNSSNFYAPVPVVPESKIRDLRQGNTITGFPLNAAIRPMSNAGTATGQRFEVLFYPNPDSGYVLSYTYTVIPNNLNGTINFPYGGAIHSETLLASCLATAESRLDDTQGEKRQDFLIKLHTSVDLDREQYPELLGYNGNNSDGIATDFRNDKQVTVDGTAVT